MGGKRTLANGDEPFDRQLLDGNRVCVENAGWTQRSSPDDIYGFPVCDPAVQACVTALPAGTTDYGSCGAYFPVTTCLNQ